MSSVVMETPKKLVSRLLVEGKNALEQKMIHFLLSHHFLLLNGSVHEVLSKSAVEKVY